MAAPPFKLDTTWSLRKSIPLDEQPWYLAQKKRKPTSVALLTDAQILCAASKKAGVKKKVHKCAIFLRLTHYKGDVLSLMKTKV